MLTPSVRLRRELSRTLTDSQLLISSGGTNLWVCRACSKTKGARERITFKSEGSRDDRNPVVESKGVPSDWKSEGSCRQTFGMTKRNRIKG